MGPLGRPSAGGESRNFRKFGGAQTRLEAPKGNKGRKARGIQE
jgi:hypothetical protein